MSYQIKKKETALKWIAEGMKFQRILFTQFRDDKEVVLEAVKKDWKAIYSSSDELKSDMEIVLEAVKGHPIALHAASKDLKLLCAGKDPIQTLERAIACEKLNAELPSKSEPTKPVLKW